MLYILEGPDCSGKSTCFQLLQERHPDALYIKESYTPNPKERLARLEKVEQLVTHCKRTVVMDRATIVDDFVYSFLNDDKKSTLADHMEDVRRVLEHSTIIYFKAPVDVLSERLSKRRDAHIDSAETLQTILDNYDKYFKTIGDSTKKVYTVDTSVHSIEGVADVVSALVFPKQFKFAHIVPVSHLSDIANNGYLMCLAHLVPKDLGYGLFYRLASERPGQYVLMDNGAAEGEQLSTDELLQIYDFIRPDEIVLPDTLLNGEETYRKAVEAIPRFKQHEGFKAKMMAVPQGKTFEEWRTCAERLIQLPEVNSIGISKFLQMEIGGEFIRLQAASTIDHLINKYDRRDIEVHLLGLSESPSTVRLIHNLYPFVRGCDSAYGYIAAQGRQIITGMMSRPVGEIDFIHGKRVDGLPGVLQDLDVITGAFGNGTDPNWKRHKTEYQKLRSNANVK